MARHHRERHRTGRIGWLRAAVLGANDERSVGTNVLRGGAYERAHPRASMTTNISPARFIAFLPP